MQKRKTDGGQAGAGVEITPEMIEGGVDVLLGYDSRDLMETSSSLIVSEILFASLRQSQLLPRVENGQCGQPSSQCPSVTVS